MIIKKQGVIDFGVWLTAYDKETVEKLFDDYNNYKERKESVPAKTLGMPKIADRWQSNLPDPLNDQQHYDIILVTGEQINDVEYWAFGGGFKPNNKPNENYVDYPESTVEFYRTHID